MSDVTNLIDKLIQTGYDPVRTQEAVLNTLEQVSNGEITVVDPTSPFVFALESSAVTATALGLRMQAVLRKQYPKMAASFEDLYLHMADVDYLGLFAAPSRTSFFMMFRRDEIYAKAVRMRETGIRKLIIPKHTVITVAGVDFTLMYPIEIRIMNHGGLQVVYDTDVRSPIQSLETNVLEWRTINVGGDKYVSIQIPLWQIKRSVFVDTLNPSTGFKKSYELGDQFYHCRVYGVGSNGVETEYSTTHSEQVYDVRRPTALLRVTGNKLTVEMPIIYFSAGLLPGQIKVEIFTTKGSMVMNMADYVPNAFTLRWGADYNSADDSLYASPFSTWEAMSVYSDAEVISGSDGIGFEEQRNRVINNANNVDIPITDVQLKTRLNLRGYDIVKSVDNVLRRTYLATRNLPVNLASGFTAGARCAIDTLQVTLDQLVGLPTVKDNGERITVLPDTLYRYNEGRVEIVPIADIPNRNVMSLDAIAKEVNTKDFIYTPFHYVLDTTNDSFSARAYYMDNPSVESRVFVMENDTAELSVSTSRYMIEKVDAGVKLTLVTKSDANYKQLRPDQMHIQLSFRPTFEVDNAFINGTLVGMLDGEFVWEFILGHEFDINADNELTFSNFTMYVDIVRPFRCPLTADFDVLYSVSDYTQFELRKTEIDNRLGRHLLPEDVLGLTHEQLNIRIGDAMGNMWSNARTVAGSLRYMTHAVDVPWTYQDTVYETDPDTGSPKVWLDNGEIMYTVLHRAGDPILDASGNPVMRFNKGELVLGLDGQPIPIQGRDTQRQIDMLFVDGLYYFATAVRDIDYRKTIPQSIVGYLRQDLDVMSQSLLENTALYFYPKRTLGFSKVIIGSGVVSDIPAGLSFKVEYYLNSVNYANMELRSSIVSETSRIINQELRKNTVSVDNIVSALSEALGEDVVAIDVAKLGPGQDLAAYTSVDVSTRCAVKRNLRVLPDGTLQAVEDIVVDFIRHTT